MATTKTESVGLDPAQCRARQDRLRQSLRRRRLEAALIRDLRHVHYFSSYWGRSIVPAAVIVPVDGPVKLVTAMECDPSAAVDEAQTFTSNHIGTLVEDLDDALLAQLSADLGRYGRHWVI